MRHTNVDISGEEWNNIRQQRAFMMSDDRMAAEHSIDRGLGAMVLEVEKCKLSSVFTKCSLPGFGSLNSWRVPIDASKEGIFGPVHIAGMAVPGLGVASSKIRGIYSNGSPPFCTPLGGSSEEDIAKRDKIVLYSSMFTSITATKSYIAEKFDGVLDDEALVQYLAGPSLRLYKESSDLVSFMERMPEIIHGYDN